MLCHATPCATTYTIALDLVDQRRLFTFWTEPCRIGHHRRQNDVVGGQFPRGKYLRVEILWIPPRDSEEIDIVSNRYKNLKLIRLPMEHFNTTINQRGSDCVIRLGVCYSNSQFLFDGLFICSIFAYAPSSSTIKKAAIAVKAHLFFPNVYVR